MNQLAKVACLYLKQAREFSPAEWKKYKAKHPKAKKKNHTIINISKKTPISERLNTVFNQIKGANQKVLESLRHAPKQTQKFVLDKNFREVSLKSAAKKIRKSSEKIKNRIIESGKTELKAIFKETPQILYSLVKDRRKPTKEELKTLYGVGVYVAGTILALKGDSPMGAIMAGSKAFGHSLTLHIAFRSMSSLLDEGFLAYEAAESAATAGDIADKLPLATGDIPGLNQIWDAVAEVGKSIVAKEELTLESLIQNFINKTADQLEAGVSDQDIISILRNKTVS